MTGLRGVGKTVLLNEIDRMAVNFGYRTIMMEAPEDKPLAALLAPQLRRVLFDLDRIAGAGDKVRRGLKVLKSFLTGIRFTIGEIDIGLDIEPEKGSADAGDIELDLPELLVAVAEAAEERRSAVAILIDEIQYFDKKELSSLIMAMHKMQQRQLPMVLIGAGLPILPGLAGESKSYAERLFSFPVLGPLSEADTTKALQDPIMAYGVTINQDALKEIYRLTNGYPYFIQEWGYQAWNHASGTPITLEIILTTTGTVINRLDCNFFRVRFDRLTPSEKQFLRAMANFGQDKCRTSDVADLLGSKLTALGPVRASLIKKGMIFSPGHGEMAFTVPLFDEFMRRTMPEMTVKKR